MDDRLHMRASDADREEVVGRLRTALDEGRLKMPEYVERMGLAYEAVTYGDLAPLHADLPAAAVAQRPAAPRAAPATGPRPARPPPRAPPAPAPPPAAGRMPVGLKVLWTIWLSAVSINVVVWVLVSATTGHAAYPWPLWVAGPAGAALFGVTVGVSHIRSDHQPPATSPPGPPAGPPPGPAG
jgi:hypothetical protein